VLLPDVNVLIYAHRSDYDDHEAYAGWLSALATGEARFGCSESVLSGFVRIVTNRKIFPTPTPIDVALDFCDAIRAAPTCVLVRPGPTHWSVFDRLCRESGARGKLVADAYHAALAIEHGCEWVTTDSDFARFRGLRWSHPLRGR
jgi:toxin-antitoxin system PIN domain toxin